MAQSELEIRQETGAKGAYGIALPDLLSIAQYLVNVPQGADAWSIAVRPTSDAPSRPDHHEIDDAEATLAMGEIETLVCERAARRATYFMDPPPSPALLVHPLLAGVAGIASHWAGSIPLHAGAFVADGAAWVVLADREHGKSTTMAELHTSGATVLCDDMAVIDAGHVMSGPRCVDLRESSASRYPEAEPLGTIGNRERIRLSLGPGVASAPLAGFVRLGWAHALEVSPTPVAERFSMIGASYALSLPPADFGAFLDLASLPCFDVVRPKQLDALGPTVEALLQLGDRI